MHLHFVRYFFTRFYTKWQFCFPCCNQTVNFVYLCLKRVIWLMLRDQFRTSLLFSPCVWMSSGSLFRCVFLAEVLKWSVCRCPCAASSLLQHLIEQLLNCYQCLAINPAHLPPPAWRNQHKTKYAKKIWKRPHLTELIPLRDLHQIIPIALHSNV